ncbi:cyanobactin maturation protease PatG family protein [Streptomyces sp. NPDC002491]
MRPDLPVNGLAMRQRRFRNAGCTFVLRPRDDRARASNRPCRYRRKGLVVEVRSILKGLRASDGLLGESRVCVAVLDGPVNLAHPCFAGADVTRLDTLVTQAAGDGPMSVHGTHVASLIFGQPGSPVVGVAPRCRGLILPVFPDACDSRVPQMDLARAIEQAVQAGAHIINISGGERTPDGHPDSMLERALRLCEERGVLVVAAVGNDGCDCLQAPAAAPSVLAVGASGIDGRPLDINNWGGAYRRNGVLAPGQDIEGADPGGGVRALTGSSFATPAASGVAALLVAAQLRRGLPPDPRAAGGAILDTASPPACVPEEAAHCRRFLVGTMNAARAYDLVTSADGPSGVQAGALEHPQAYAGSDTAKGVNAMESTSLNTSVPQESSPASDVVGEGARAAMSVPAPPAQPPSNAAVTGAQQGDDCGAPSGVRPACGCGCGGGDSCAEAQGGSAGTASLSAAAATPAQAAVAVDQPKAPVGSAAPDPVESLGRQDGPRLGLRPSCACGQSAGRPLVYAIGTVGFDYGSEARRDSFRQAMPFVEGPPDAQGRPSEVQPDPYNPQQLRDYLVRNPWASDKLTWTLMVDSSPIYALEAEPAVGMDYSDVFDEERVRAAVGVQTDLEDLLVQLAQPPVSVVHRTFRDSIVGQIRDVDAEDYVSRVSIPGVLTDRTTRLFSGQVVPVVEVKSRGIYTWNEHALVEAVLARVNQDNADRAVVMPEDRLRKTVRALLDKLYYQFRNLGQTDGDRALNFAGTNAFLFGNTFADGLLGAKYVPGEEDRFYSLDTITVSKSSYCREGSNCYEVVTNFFDPENDQRSRLSFLQTIDVSIEVPVSVAPVHQFLGSM